MKTITDPQKRKEVVDAYLAYSNAYARRDWDQMVQWMAEGMTMFGTAVDEVAFNGDLTRSMLGREFGQAPMPISSKITGMEVYELCPEIALIMLTMDICIHSRGLEIDCPNHRASIIMKKWDDGWKVIHGHWSQPDKDIDVGESVPYRLLIERSEQLENIIAERTRKIDSQNKELKAINDTKDKLFSIIAHDLKNPFNSILGFSSLLYENLEGYDSKKIKQILRAIHQQAVNTYDLLENLLDWAKSQSDIIIFSPKNIRLHPLVHDVITHFDLVAKNKDIVIDLDVPDVIMIHADRQMLQIVLRNLISNALKFTHQGGRVVVMAREEDHQVNVSIADNGVGIADNVKAELLSGLTTEAKQGTANETGTGLGLILSREFVARHGGRIWLESELGEGSSFIFTIPSADAKDKPV